MANDRRQSFDLSTDDPGKLIHVAIRYSKPDGSYASSRPEQQGYWITITPVKFDGIWRTQTAFSGIKSFLMPAKRFSQKTLDDLFYKIRFEILTGHTEDRWVKKVIEVAESAELRITHWSNALKESNRPDFKSIVDNY